MQRFTFDEINDLVREADALHTRLYRRAVALREAGRQDEADRAYLLAYKACRRGDRRAVRRKAILRERPCAQLQADDVIRAEGAGCDAMVGYVYGKDDSHIYVWWHAANTPPLAYPLAWFDAFLREHNFQVFTGHAARSQWNLALRALR
ncbi:MAG: hypothetical protein KDI55_24970 [Anaerolineae bacterium]|nr:hypothetical protein [Anaerolineae bacterium]